jgi:hypothetical protein
LLPLESEREHLEKAEKLYKALCLDVNNGIRRPSTCGRNRLPGWPPGRKHLRFP